jgi:transposase-like protein
VPRGRRWDPARRELVRERIEKFGHTVARVARDLGVTRGAIIGQAIRGNIQPPGRRGPIVLADDHPAIIELRTLFPTRVFDPEDEPLKSGANQRKLGGMVTKGDWKGFPIYTLTLEERATCPMDCAVLRECYGNGMPFSKRLRHGELLEARLFLQLERLAVKHAGGFVVRLHILGDFYSSDYVRFWFEALEQYPMLHIFGYTGWQQDSEIGNTIKQLRIVHPKRFRVRVSGAARGFRTIVVDKECQAWPAIVCPVETGRARSCGTCTLCWATDKPIAFLRH